MIWGTTFSQKYAQDLGLDWKESFTTILDEFNFKVIRLCAYWDLIEKTPDQFDFSDLEWQLEQAANRGVKVTLSLGRKVPRWPEFHEPMWAIEKDYQFLETSLFNYLEATIEHLKSHEIIDRWQIENEPFWNFGKSQYPIKEETVIKELELTRQLDTRPIVLTDTGTWSFWRKATKYGDQVGVNVYPIVYRKGKYHRQPERAIWYKIKKRLINKPILISELQTEAWGPGNIQDLQRSEWQQSISAQKLEENVKLALKTSINEAWLWGAEWWVFLKENGDPELFNKAKELIA